MTIRRLVLRFALPLSFFSAFGIVTQACGSQAQDICEAACNCEGCDEEDFNNCVAELEDLRQDSAGEGCDSDYEDLLSCMNSKMDCEDDEVDLEDCADELEELAECLEDPVFGVSVEGGGGDDDDDPPGGGSACDRMQACCVAAAEEAMVSTANCDGYDAATEAACQAAIDAYMAAPGIAVPSECQF